MTSVKRVEKEHSFTKRETDMYTAIENIVHDSVYLDDWIEFQDGVANEIYIGLQYHDKLTVSKHVHYQVARELYWARPQDMTIVKQLSHGVVIQIDTIQDRLETYLAE